MVRFLTKEAALILLLGLACPDRLRAADFSLVPSIGLSEDATDNINETVAGRRGDLVTRVQPGFLMKYGSSRATLEAAYNLEYRNYLNNNGTDGINHALALQGTCAVIKDFFTIDLSDTFSRISLDVARDNTAESLSQAQTDQNTLTVSPYLLWRLGSKSILKTGGRYSDVRYWSPDGIDRSEEGGFAQLTHELAEKLSLTAGYTFNNTATRILNYQDHDVSIGLRYQYADKSFLFGTLGNGWQDYSNGSRSNHLLWDAGIINDFGIFLATLETQARYSEDPLTVELLQTSYSAKLDKVLLRGKLGLYASYDEYVAAQTGEMDRRGVTVSAVASRELRSGLTASLNITGDHLSRRSTLDFPYHLSATGALEYAFNHDATLGLTYTYATYRYRIDRGDGSVEVNRVVAQVKKSF